MEKTAVEWFFNELQRMQYFIGNDMLEAYKQANKMFEKQIIDAVTYGQNNYTPSTNADKEIAKNYYHHTFKQD